MNVLYLMGSLHRGGTETLILDTFRHNNQDIQFFCTYRYKNGVFEKDFLESGVSMHFIPYKNKTILIYLWKLRRFIQFNNIQIIHAHQPIDAFYALLACVGLKIPIVQTHHGFDFETRGIATVALKQSLRYVHLNIFVSNTQRDYYINKYKFDKKKHVVIYNGISFQKFTSAQSEKFASGSLRTELSISKNKLLLVSVGNFTEVRNQLFICKFINLLKNHFVDFHFVFVGSKVDRFPEYYDNCVRYCMDNGIEAFVSFLGNRNDVPQILFQSDAFIYSTNYDTFGIAAVEAMAAGIPVFLNDWGVMKEITDNGKYATLYNTNDELDLLRKFMLFLQDKTQFIQNAAIDSGYLINKYSLENYISNLHNKYKMLLKS